MHMKSSNLVDKIDIMIAKTGTLIISLEYDKYNDKLNVVGKNMKAFRDLSKHYTIFNFPIAREQILLKYVYHMLKLGQDVYHLGTGNHIVFEMDKIIQYDFDKSFKSQLANLCVPHYSIQCKEYNSVYNIYVPQAYTALTIMKYMYNKDVVVPDWLRTTLDGSSNGFDPDGNVKYCKGLFGFIRNRFLHELVEEYIKNTDNFISFFRKQEFGSPRSLKGLVESRMSLIDDYLLRDEIEVSMLNALFGFTHKGRYIENAYTTIFSDILLGKQVPKRGELSSIIPKSLHNKIVAECGYFLVEGFNSRGSYYIDMYVTKKSLVVCKVEFTGTKALRFSDIVTTEKEISDAIRSIYLFDTHTKNILISSGELKDYFIETHRGNYREIEYFKEW